MSNAEQEPTSPDSDHPQSSGVDDTVEEGAAVEPQDAEAVEDPSASAADSSSDTEVEADPVAAAEQALAERTADLQRLQAEYANYRRRVERDREQVRENATFAALTPIVEVLDTIDRAQEHGELEGGFKAVADQLERVVADRGLERFGAPGDEFDPTLHEALSHIGTDPEVSVTTCKVIAKAGYRIGERVVRAAQVLVVDPVEGEPAGHAPESTTEEAVENEE